TCFRDSTGNFFAGIADSTTWNFTAADIDAPTVVSLSPADEATGVASQANLVITFSEPVSKGTTGDIVIRRASDTSVFETIAATDTRVTVSGTQVTINPAGAFTSLAGYYVQISGTCFRDATGNFYAGIADTTTWNFTAADIDAPTMVSLSPGDNATGVATQANLVITFSEPVTKGTTGDIVIRRASDASVFETIAATDTRVTVVGNQAAIDPAGTFDSQTGYYVLIAPTCFLDGAGNSFAGIAASTIWSFSTANVSLPAIANVRTTGSSGDILLTYDLSQGDSDPCSILVEYSLDGAVSWASTTALTGSTTGLLPGVDKTVVWNSNANINTNQPVVLVRITPNDGTPGTAGSSLGFAVNNNTPPTAFNVLASGATGDITLTYDLADAEGHPCSISVAFSLDGGTSWTNTTNLTGSTTSIFPGTARSVIWHSATDFSTYQPTVQARITPNDGSPGTPGSTSGFAVNNNHLPVVSGVSPSGVANDITITYTLADPDGDNCDIGVEYSLDGGTTFASTTQLTGTTTALAPGPGKSIIWHSYQDFTDDQPSVKVRIQPADYVASGTAGESGSFAVNNNQAPGQPTIASPMALATGVPVNPFVSSTAFADGDAGDTHLKTDWEIFDDPGLAGGNRVWVFADDALAKTWTNVGPATGTFENALAGKVQLFYEHSYWARCRFFDNHGKPGSWSSPLQFTTASHPVQLSAMPAPLDLGFGTPTFTIATVPFTVNNSGIATAFNLKIDTGNLVGPGTIDEANIAITFPPTPLGSGSLPATCSVFVPAATPAGVYTGSQVVFEDADSDDIRDPDEAMVSLPVQLTVSSVALVTIPTPLVDVGYGHPGDVVSGNVPCVNNGNVSLEHLFWIKGNLQSGADFISLGNYSVTTPGVLVPGDSFLASITLSISPVQADGNYVSSPAIVLFEDANANFTLDAGEVSASFSLACAVGYKVLDVLEASASLGIASAGMTTATATFTVQNTGVIALSNVRAQGPILSGPGSPISGVALLPTMPWSISPSATTSVQLSVPIPGGQTLGVYSGTMIVWEDDNANLIVDPAEATDTILIDLTVE
ncbi:MAG: Ig-like domain-containing protein, partial [Candidatus Riflebacteria bacterium]|nr:Ig-like domain-containing protein [Candidatus Riflebacteria bacterium]